MAREIVPHAHVAERGLVGPHVEAVDDVGLEGPVEEDVMVSMSCEGMRTTWRTRARRARLSTTRPSDPPSTEGGSLGRR